MIHIFFLSIAIYLIYFIGKRLIKLVKHFYGFSWSNVRPKDAVIAGGVICAIILFEWLIPSTQLTGMHIPLKRDPAFFITQQPNPIRPYTPTELSKSAPWLQYSNLSLKELLEKKIKLYENKLADEEALKVKLSNAETTDDQEIDKFNVWMQQTENSIVRTKTNLRETKFEYKFHFDTDLNYYARFGILGEPYTAPDIFPKLPGYIEIITREKKPSGFEIFAPKSKTWDSDIAAYFKAFKNDVRHHHEPESKLSCGYLLNKENGSLKTERICELITPLQIDMDVTANYCPEKFAKMAAYKLPKTTHKNLDDKCIERWKFPYLRIQFTPTHMTLYEPVSNVDLEKHILKNGSPLTSWQIKFDNIEGAPIRKLDKKIIIPWDGKSDFSVFTLYHNARPIENIENVEDDYKLYYWNDYSLDKFTKIPIFGLLPPKNLSHFIFKNHRDTLVLNKDFSSIIAAFVQPKLQITLDDTIKFQHPLLDHKALLAILNKQLLSVEVGLLDYEVPSMYESIKEALLLQCNLSYSSRLLSSTTYDKPDMEKAAQGLLYSIETIKGSATSCDGFNAIKAMMESMKLYMETPPQNL